MSRPARPTTAAALVLGHPRDLPARRGRSLAVEPNPRLAKLLTPTLRDLGTASAAFVSVSARENPLKPPRYGHGSGTPRARVLLTQDHLANVDQGSGWQPHPWWWKFLTSRRCPPSLPTCGTDVARQA